MFRIDETMVYGNSKRGSKSKWNSDPSSRDGDGKSNIATDDRHVDLKSDEEEEETEADVRYKREIGYRLGGENVLGKAGYSAKGSRP